VEDLERNDGSEEKPYYMSKKLKKILGKKNKRNSDSEWASSLQVFWDWTLVSMLIVIAGIIPINVRSGRRCVIT
jgi:hypothetical protein